MTRGGVETPGGGGAISPDGPDITADAVAIPAVTNGRRVHLELLRGRQGGGGAWGRGSEGPYGGGRDCQLRVVMLALQKLLLDTGGNVTPILGSS